MPELALQNMLCKQTTYTAKQVASASYTSAHTTANVASQGNTTQHDTAHYVRLKSVPAVGLCYSHAHVLTSFCNSLVGQFSMASLFLGAA